MVGLTNNAAAMVYAGDVVRGRITRHRLSSYLYDYLVAPQQPIQYRSELGREAGG